MGRPSGFLSDFSSWGDSADEHRFGDSPLAVPCDIARHLAATRGVADVDGILEIKRLREFGNIGSVGVHVIAVHCLSGTIVSAAIMSNYPVTAVQEKHHLGVPVVSRQRPTSTPAHLLVVPKGHGENLLPVIK
jgi:hypothetical protein